ncbi:glycosyltransferase [Limnobacter sp.]|uniref:glycosyltransferase n=1 Tax=Limnobacter sp. TaxID=2003368 RepID=UPI003525D923
MPSSNCLVSIVMPTWNSMRYIKECIASLLAQTHNNYELLVCDGGSTDGTLEYLESIGDPRIQIVSRQDTGLVNALNIGFSKTSGDILCWLNSDDRYLCNNILARVVDKLKSGDLQFVIGGCAMLAENGQIMRYLLPWIPQPPFKYRGHSNCFTGSLFFKKAAWAKFGQFSEQNKYAFEYELVRQLMAFPQQGRILTGPPVAGFRLRPDSVSGANSHAMALERNMVVGNVVHENAPFKHQLIRLYSYARLGLLPTFLKYLRANRNPKAVRNVWKN